jgi:hypothetical protein
LDQEVGLRIDIGGAGHWRHVSPRFSTDLAFDGNALLLSKSGRERAALTNSRPIDSSAASATGFPQRGQRQEPPAHHRRNQGRVGFIRLIARTRSRAQSAMISEIASAVDAFEADAGIGCMAAT